MSESDTETEFERDGARANGKRRESGEDSEEEEFTSGPWVAKGNAPGYLDSDDERVLEEAGIVAEAENHLLDEILGEFDEDGEDGGKARVSSELDKIREKMETIQGLEDEVEELKERLERERKWNNVLADTNRGLMEERRNTEAEEKFEKISNFLVDTIRCSRGRPVATLIGAVEDHLEKLEVRSKEDPKFRNLKSETQRKTEKLKKVEEEKKVLVEEKKKLEERLTVVVSKPAKKAELIEVDIQASPDMVDAATESQEEILVEEKKKKRQRESKGKGKEKEGAKHSIQIQEDVEMVDEERFALHEDLSDYEKEEEVVKDTAPVTPPITKKQPTKRQV
ncbi:hypothetical protein BGX38DRAFT_1279726 [Terfezia claveryi]|nr:hypothetical protein BGX38DRAFT_1279726 [Terfezia claveryi]